MPRQRRTYPLPPADRPTLSVLEAAAMLGVGETTIRERVKADTIPHFRMGKRVLFRRVDLEKMMDPNYQAAAE